MKEQLIDLVHQALKSFIENNNLPPLDEINIQITPTKQKSHGDYSCNIALILSKKINMKPRDLAEKIISYLPSSGLISKSEIAGPGFINFFLKQESQAEVIREIFEKKENYGRSLEGKNKKVNIEFVSANPTGPLHVGHGRGAAIGSAIANILDFYGYNVTREYYVNDAGRQMDILATSIWLRYLQSFDIDLTFPVNGYKGEYIYKIADTLVSKFNDKLTTSKDALYKDIHLDYDAEKDIGDKDKHIDGLIQNAKSILKKEYNEVHKLGLNYILDDIKEDLSEFKVNMDVWFSEKSLMTSNDVNNAISKLKNKGLMYESNGAQWFKSEELGDEKDRVVVRNNGNTTYFASDAAYMSNKFNRNFDEIIYIFGADHHGYIPRLMALAQAFNLNKKQIKIPLVQFANLYKNGEQVQMSTRSGSFVTLRDLKEEVGVDAARFFYIMRKMDQHLDFDLDLAKSKSNENPVYYIQYAHARICSVFRQLAEKNMIFQPTIGLDNLELLNNDIELSIINKLIIFKDIIQKSAAKLEPHLLTTYLRELANIFHTYYNSSKFILDDENKTQARLMLINSIKQVFVNSLNILGISTPESM